MVIDPMQPIFQRYPRIYPFNLSFMNILLLLVCLFLDSSFNSMHMLRFIIMYKIQSYISLVQCSGINLDFQLLFMKDSCSVFTDEALLQQCRSTKRVQGSEWLSKSREINIHTMSSELSDLSHLVLGPESATGDNAGVAGGRVELASDGRAIVKSEHNVGVTDASSEGPRRSEVTNIVITELGVAASKLGDGTGEASEHVVEDPVDGEQAREAPRGFRNGVEKSFGSIRHW